MANPIAKRLKQARLQADISQKQLGIKAKIDEFSASPRINQYERAKHTPNFDMAQRLAKVLKVPTPYLYASDNDMAEMIHLFGMLSPTKRKRILRELSKQAKK